MTTHRADSERTIKAHRRPQSARPKTIIPRGKRINKRTHLAGFSGKLSLMDIQHMHQPTPKTLKV
jgi:hypothetical protein